MRNKFPLFAFLALAAALASGCASAEKKLGRGVSNTCEIVRMGELRRSVEQTALFDGPEVGYTTGVVRGLKRTFVRTGAGIYEVVTFPFPSYDAPLSNYLAPSPVYPDNYRPGLSDSSTFATDTSLGYSGGDVAPLVPGSRFSVFDAH